MPRLKRPPQLNEHLESLRDRLQNRLIKGDSSYSRKILGIYQRQTSSLRSFNPDSETDIDRVAVLLQNPNLGLAVQILGAKRAISLFEQYNVQELKDRIDSFSIIAVKYHEWNEIVEFERLCHAALNFLKENQSELNQRGVSNEDFDGSELPSEIITKNIIHSPKLSKRFDLKDARQKLFHLKINFFESLQNAERIEPISFIINLIEDSGLDYEEIISRTKPHRPQRGSQITFSHSSEPIYSEIERLAELAFQTHNETKTKRIGAILDLLRKARFNEWPKESIGQYTFDDFVYFEAIKRQVSTNELVRMVQSLEFEAPKYTKQIRREFKRAFEKCFSVPKEYGLLFPNPEAEWSKVRPEFKALIRKRVRLFRTSISASKNLSKVTVGKRHIQLHAGAVEQFKQLLVDYFTGGDGLSKQEITAGKKSKDVKEVFKYSAKLSRIRSTEIVSYDSGVRKYRIAFLNYES